MMWALHRNVLQRETFDFDTLSIFHFLYFREPVWSLLQLQVLRHLVTDCGMRSRSMSHSALFSYMQLISLNDSAQSFKLINFVVFLFWLFKAEVSTEKKHREHQASFSPPGLVHPFTWRGSSVCLLFLKMKEQLSRDIWTVMMMMSSEVKDTNFSKEQIWSQIILWSFEVFLYRQVHTNSLKKALKAPPPSQVDWYVTLPTSPYRHHKHLRDPALMFSFYSSDQPPIWHH